METKDSSTVTARDFNIHLSLFDRTSRQKITEDEDGFNDTINQSVLNGLQTTPNNCQIHFAFQVPLEHLST